MNANSSEIHTFSWGRFHFVVLSLPHAEEKAPHPSLSPWRGKRRPTSQVGAAYDQKAMGKSTLVQNKICDHEIILDGKG
jgi:hypothetical protein